MGIDPKSEIQGIKENIDWQAALSAAWSARDKKISMMSAVVSKSHQMCFTLIQLCCSDICRNAWMLCSK
jgi:hypothetical protein